MADCQKNQIISKKEFTDHLSNPIPLFYRKEDKGEERLNNLPKFTQLISDILCYCSADSKPRVPSTLSL